MRRVMCLLALAAVGCGRDLYDVATRDASEADVDADLDADRDGGAGIDAGNDAATRVADFGPTFEGAIEQTAVSSTTREFGASMTSDRLALVVASYMTAPTGANLYLSRRLRVTDAFGAPVLLASVATTEQEGEPAWADDGGSIYFDRDDATGLHRCRLVDDDCVDDTPVEGLGSFGGADLAVDETRLVVHRDGDLYEAVRSTRADPWSAPVLLMAIASAEYDSVPSLREDGLEIFWERSGAGGPFIYRALRARLDAPFGTPERVTFTNLDAPAGDPDISDDGTTLLFVADDPSGGTGEFDVYVATRRPL